MKKQYLFFILLIIGNKIFSQGVFNTSINESLATIIKETPEGFINIKGELKYSASGTKHYASKIEIEDALECLISMREKDEPGIWNAVILETSIFEEADYRYRLVYEEISKTIIRPSGEKPYILSGEFHRPSVNIKTVSSRFSLLPAAGTLKNVVVILVLEKMNNQYRLSLHVMQDDDLRLTAY